MPNLPDQSILNNEQIYLVHVLLLNIYSKAFYFVKADLIENYWIYIW